MTIYFPKKVFKKNDNDKFIKVKVNSIDKSTSSKYKFEKRKIEVQKWNDEKKYIKKIRDMINHETDDNSSDSILKEVTDYIEKQ